MHLKTKNLSFKVDDVDVKTRTVTLYFAAFNIVDSDGDMIVKGAFEKNFREWGPGGKNRIWHLDNHSPLRKLGKPKELIEDDYGARAVSQIRDTTLGRDIMAFYDAGDINEHSFGYVIEKGEPSDEAYILKELKTFEYSTVAWGANEFTPTEEVKDLAKYKEKLEHNMQKWAKWLNRGSITDEMCELLEIQIMHWSKAIKDLQPSQSGDTDTEPSQSGDTQLVESIDKYFSQKKFLLRYDERFGSI